MISYYKGNIPIINDDPDTRDIENPSNAVKGYVPRDYSLYPQEMFDAPSTMQLIPESDLDAIYDEQEARQSSLEHLFIRDGVTPAFVNLDQNGHGYCWAYSTGHAIMMQRLASGQPMVRLNPHGTAAIIKGGKDEGGWCGLSGKFAEEHGYGPEGNGPGEWPLHSRSLSNDTPAFRANCAKCKVTESYVDLTRDVYDRNLTEQQLWTCLARNQPGPVDFNHWGHSVCAIRWVRIERGSFGLLILNSWKGWGRLGLGVLQGSKRRPDGALCVRVTTA